jgi:hypothetical protein
VKVSIIKDWEGDLMRQTPQGKGIWDGIKFISGNSMTADVVVVLNSTPVDFFGFYRKGGKWLMSQEPPHESYRWQTRGYRYFDKLFTFWMPSEFPESNIINEQTCLPWHVNRSYDELIALRSDALVKQDKISWITSNLNSRPGHELRLGFMDFLRKQGFQFDLFGRGFDPIVDKFDGLAPYKYSIAIENYSCNDYWTEKIADCFLSWSMPIYFGCSNITRYFPRDSMILVDPRDPAGALQIIQDAIDGNLWQKRLSQIEEARNLILNKYQFFPAIAKRIRGCEVGAAGRTFSIIKKVR